MRLVTDGDHGAALPFQRLGLGQEREMMRCALALVDAACLK
jgi:hypothetical protein